MPSKPSRPKPALSLWQFEAIGTHWSVETHEPLTNELKKSISKLIEDFDQAYSRFRPDSIVTEMASRAGEFSFPKSSSELVGFYRRLYDATDGAVTPLVGQLLADSGYDAAYSFEPSKLRDVPMWDDAMTWHGNSVTTAQPVLLDFGAAGKGYLVDQVGELLEKNGVQKYVIDASGDIRQRGEPAERVGLENPQDASLVIGLVELHNRSLCASATNRRLWGKGLHHVFDPRTKKPVGDVIATWVMSETTMQADGLATALFFVDAEQLLGICDFDYVRLKSDGTIEHSPGSPVELYI